MADAGKKYHEEDEIGKTYDLRVAGRLMRYLKPYWPMAAGALVLTLIANILFSTQPYFTKVAVDGFIIPKRTDGIWLFARYLSSPHDPTLVGQEDMIFAQNVVGFGRQSGAV